MTITGFQNTICQRVRQSFWLKCSLGLLVLALAFGAFGFLAGPPIAKSLLVNQLSKTLHRPVSIETIAINPYALSARVGGFSVRSTAGHEVFGFDSLRINLEAISLWRGGPVVSELVLDGPRLRLTRQEGGRYDISDLIDEWTQPAANSQPARFALYNIQIAGGRLLLVDQPGGVTHAVDDLKLQLPFLSNLPYQTDIHVQPYFSARINGSPLVLQGRSKPFDPSRESELSLDLDRVNLVQYLAYSPVKLPFTVQSAVLDSELKLQFRQAGKEAGTLKLAGAVHLNDVALKAADGASLMTWKRLDVGLDGLDLVHNTLAFGEIRLNGLQQNLHLDAEGKLNWLGLLARLKGGAASPAKKPDSSQPLQLSVREILLEEAGWLWHDTAQGKRPSSVANPQQLRVREARLKGLDLNTGTRQVALAEMALQGAEARLRRDAYGFIDVPRTESAVPTPDSQSWLMSLGRIEISGSALRYEEEGEDEPRVQQLNDVRLSLEGMTTTPGKPVRLSLAARVNQKGSLQLAGQVQMQPLRAGLDLDLVALPVLPVQPLFSDQLNVTLLRGQLSGKGHLNLAEGKDGLGGDFKGRLQVGDLHCIDKINRTDLLRWKTLAVDRIDARLRPFSLDVGEVALSDFYARMIVTPEGKLNLSQIIRQPEAEKSPDGVVARDAKGHAQATLAKTEKSASVPPIRIANVRFTNGRVNFSDLFVKPNYSVNVTKIAGSIRGLSSAADTVADLELHGGYGNAAPVDIVAKLNPLAAKTYLDLKGEIRGVDLTTLSTYSGKYAGYAIEKGKLSLFVTYKLENNQLNAENRLFVDQLTFGDKVDSPDATSLPVNLAVALLKNSRGEIDINLPISGSLDDPEFSVGGLVVRVIVNLFVKVVTSPFALLSSIFGGGSEELSRVEFAPGFSRLTPETVKKLEIMAKAMNDRPALKLEVTGRVDPQADLEGGRRVALDRAVRAEKQKELVKKGVETGPLNSIEVEAREYPEYLRRVYKEAKFKKPTNFIGMQKDLPVDEMEKMLLANTSVSEDDLHQLAARRGQVVQAWLVGEGKVAMERVFLMAPKLKPDEKDEGKGSASRVDFSLR